MEQAVLLLVVRHWLDGDPNMPPPPASREKGRNAEWGYFHGRDVMSMPDKWEYPWFAAWDLASHMLPFARIDPQVAKDQLILLWREWYMHPNGQIPAYEFAFGDANPPVNAWADLEGLQDHGAERWRMGLLWNVLSLSVRIEALKGLR